MPRARYNMDRLPVQVGEKSCRRPLIRLITGYPPGNTRTEVVLSPVAKALPESLAETYKAR